MRHQVALMALCDLRLEIAACMGPLASDPAISHASGGYLGLDGSGDGSEALLAEGRLEHGRQLVGNEIFHAYSVSSRTLLGRDVPSTLRPLIVEVRARLKAAHEATGCPREAYCDDLRREAFHCLKSAYDLTGVAVEFLLRAGRES